MKNPKLQDDSPEIWDFFIVISLVLIDNIHSKEVAQHYHDK